jgi:hypothetical protein
MKTLKLDKLTTAVTNATGRTGLKIAKHSPEILMVAGVVGIVASTVLACRATLKLDEVVDAAKVTVDRINDAKVSMDPEKYSETDAQKDLFITYMQTGVKVFKLYAPAITLGVLSISSILYSHKIMKGRNMALMAAFKGVDEAFKSYRKRVVEDLGVEKDREYKYGVKKEVITETITDEKGKTKEVKKVIDVLDGSQYAQIFDHNSSNWNKNPDYNMSFLKANQNFANDILQAKGHIFLNEVYDMVDVPRTQAGAITGWVKGSGDDFVDFGIFECNMANGESSIGYDRAILLDFNVDGVIWDKI